MTLDEIAASMRSGSWAGSVQLPNAMTVQQRETLKAQKKLLGEATDEELMSDGEDSAAAASGDSPVPRSKPPPVSLSQATTLTASTRRSLVAPAMNSGTGPMTRARVAQMAEAAKVAAAAAAAEADATDELQGHVDMEEDPASQRRKAEEQASGGSKKSRAAPGAVAEAAAAVNAEAKASAAAAAASVASLNDGYESDAHSTVATRPDTAFRSLAPSTEYTAFTPQRQQQQQQQQQPQPFPMAPRTPRARRVVASEQPRPPEATGKRRQDADAEALTEGARPRNPGEPLVAPVGTTDPAFAKLVSLIQLEKKAEGVQATRKSKAAPSGIDVNEIERALPELSTTHEEASKVVLSVYDHGEFVVVDKRVFKNIQRFFRPAVKVSLAHSPYHALMDQMEQVADATANEIETSVGAEEVRATVAPLERLAQAVAQLRKANAKRTKTEDIKAIKEQLATAEQTKMHLTQALDAASKQNQEWVRQERQLTEWSTRLGIQLAVAEQALNLKPNLSAPQDREAVLGRWTAVVAGITSYKQQALEALQQQSQSQRGAPTTVVRAPTQDELVAVARTLVPTILALDGPIHKWFGFGDTDTASAEQLTRYNAQILSILQTEFGSDLKAARASHQLLQQEAEKIRTAAQNDTAFWTRSRDLLQKWMKHEGLAEANLVNFPILLDTVENKVNTLIQFKRKVNDVSKIDKMIQLLEAQYASVKSLLAGFREYFKLSEPTIDNLMNDQPFMVVVQTLWNYLSHLKACVPNAGFAAVGAVYNCAIAIKADVTTLLRLAGVEPDKDWLEDHVKSRDFVSQATQNLQGFITTWDEWGQTHIQLLNVARWFVPIAALNSATEERDWVQKQVIPKLREISKQEKDASRVLALSQAEQKRDADRKQAAAAAQELEKKTVAISSKNLELQSQVEQLTEFITSLKNAEWVTKLLPESMGADDSSLQGLGIALGVAITKLEQDKKLAEERAEAAQRTSASAQLLLEDSNKNVTTLTQQLQQREVARIALESQLAVARQDAEQIKQQLALVPVVATTTTNAAAAAVAVPAKAPTAAPAAKGKQAAAEESAPVNPFDTPVFYKGIKLPLNQQEIDRIKNMKHLDSKVEAIQKHYKPNDWTDLQIEGLSVLTVVNLPYLLTVLGLPTAAPKTEAPTGAAAQHAKSAGEIRKEMEELQRRAFSGVAGTKEFVAPLRANVLHPTAAGPVPAPSSTATPATADPFNPNVVLQALRKADAEEEKGTGTEVAMADAWSPRVPEGVENLSSIQQLVSFLSAQLYRTQKQLHAERRVAVQTIGRLHAAVTETLAALAHMAPEEQNLVKPDVPSAAVELNAEFGLGLLTAGTTPSAFAPVAQLRLEASPTLTTPQGALTAASALLMLTDGSESAPKRKNEAPIQVDLVHNNVETVTKATSQALVKWDADYQKAARVKVDEKAVVATMGKANLQMQTYRAQTGALVHSQGAPVQGGALAFDWSKVVAVANADIANLATAVTGAFKNAKEMFAGLTKLQRDANALRTELQSFIGLSTSIIGSYDNATNTLLGGDERKFIETVQLSNEVRKLMSAVGSGEHWWVEQSHQLLRTTFLTLACMSRGRLECDQLLRDRLRMAAPERVPRSLQNQLRLTADIKQLIIGQPAGPATQLVHWGHHAPETAKWLKGMNNWGIQAQSDLMVLPDECMPGIIELLHADSARTFSNPQLLCLGSWPFDLTQKAIARAHKGAWFAIANATARYLAPDSPSYFPFPCDANTLVLTQESWEAAVAKLRGYFLQPKLDTDTVLPNSRIELAYVNHKTGEVETFPDLRRHGAGTPTAAVLSVHDKSRTVTAAPSIAQTTDDLVVRVRWLRFARRLRDFESLTRVPVNEAQKALDEVYEKAHGGISVFLDLPPLEMSSAVPHLEGARVIEGKPHRETPQESLLEIAADAQSYANARQLVIPDGGANTDARDTEFFPDEFQDTSLVSIYPYQ